MLNQEDLSTILALPLAIHLVKVVSRLWTGIKALDLTALTPHFSLFLALSTTIQPGSLGAVNILYQPNMGESRPPLDPLSAKNQKMSYRGRSPREILPALPARGKPRPS